VSAAPAADRRPGLGVLAFALLFPTAMAYLYFVAAPRPEPAPPVAGAPVAEPAVNHTAQALYSAGKLVQFGLPVAYFLRADPRRLRPGKPSFAGLGLGLAFGLLTVAGMLGLYFALLYRSGLVAAAAVKVRDKVEEFGIRSPAAYVALAVFLSGGHSFLEEYYWRWFVHAGLRRHLPGGWAVLVSSLGFMGHHVVILAAYLPGRFWSAAVPLSLCIAAGGAVWAWLYDRTRSVYAPWVSHLLVDAGIMVMGYDLMFVRAGSA
jgi:membrane protease YdiL (CAAX protease family)